MDNRCICCGEIIPDGRQVCPKCERKEFEKEMIEEMKEHEAFCKTAEERVKAVEKETAAKIIEELLKNTRPTFDKDGKPIIEINADFALNTCKKYGIKWAE